jgi:uncharacterized protein (TIGR02186 family)
VRWLAALLLMLATSPAAAQPRLIADVSQSRIDIEYSFAGAELLIFGAIQYPGGRTPEKAPDIAVIVRGPPEPITVRRKEKVLGIWMNVDAVRFETAPAFYAIATSAPSTHLTDERTASIYELGLDHLQLSPASGNPPEEIRTFEEGLLDLRRRAGLYSETAGGVDIVEKVLYRARVAIPSDVPVGRYTAEIYLIRDGEVQARAAREIEIDKSGFERAVYVAAQDNEVAYGLFAVALALISGWAASAVVRRG